MTAVELEVAAIKAMTPAWKDDDPQAAAQAVLRVALTAAEAISQRERFGADILAGIRALLPPAAKPVGPP